ncbi:MAG: GTP-binding protein, partial [Verrucomicrobiae bacterium]|nr:GTP-binding protein [Verrucomicrobiae bacterium]
SGISPPDRSEARRVENEYRSRGTEYQEKKMMIWDLAGRDEFQSVRKSYLRGADGFMFVADGTRRETLDAIRDERAEMAEELDSVPSVLLINKCDLEADWEIEEEALTEFREAGFHLLKTSARTGQNVAEGFEALARLTCGEKEAGANDSEGA